MLSFENDYSEGALPAILRKLSETNLENSAGYGADPWSESARRKIREACECPGADVYFLAGGTQTNRIAADTVAQPFSGVISAESGHISVHEAGAIESTGRKVLTMPGKEGKIDSDSLRSWIRSFYADANHEHMVLPGMVYISHPTELGTLYSKKELQALRSVCSEAGIPLYLDGARLGYALGCSGNDLSLPDIAALTDVFYIGGTKVGVLIGEALVFPNGAPAHFITRIKRQGALLAKGRLAGIQFDVLFSEGLYLSAGRRAVEQADKIRRALEEWGVSQVIDSPTNQIFLEMDDEKLMRLRRSVRVSFWEKRSGSRTVIRLATSWATTDAQIDELLPLLKECF